MLEKVKRLTPKKKTLRELYLKSGNQCAFPGCFRVIIDSDGNFVGQICHIEAAEKGGERFNPKMTNEDRRSLNNLMLMCYEHHIVTNDIEAYRPERLQQIKANHEVKFTDIGGVIRGSIVDHTKREIVTYATSLTQYRKVYGLRKDRVNPSISELIEYFNQFADQLSKLPINTRELIVILLERAEEYDLSFANQGMRVLLAEMELITGLYPNQLKDHLDILKQHKLARLILFDDDDDGRKVAYGYLYHESGINVWLDIKYFCSQTGTPLAEIVENLQFHLLD